MKRIFLALAILLAGTTCQAALFLGPSAFSSPPTSQMGTVTNNLVLTDNANGFVVSGQLIVNIPSTSIAGTLATWTVDRPLDPAYGSGTLTTTTVLSGFSQPPAGTAGNTNGFVESIFTNYLGTPTSLSLIPTSLVAGVDSPPWISLSVTSTPFSYTSGGTNFLRQLFQLDGIYLGGPGGNWIVDVPVRTTANVVPEPSTFAMLGTACVALLGYRLRRRLA